MSNKVRGALAGLLVGALMIAVAIWAAREADGVRASSSDLAWSAGPVPSASPGASSSGSAAPSAVAAAAAASSTADYPSYPRGFERWCRKGGGVRAKTCHRLLSRSFRQTDRVEQRERGDRSEWRQLSPRKQPAMKRTYRKAWLRRYGSMGTPLTSPRDPAASAELPRSVSTPQQASWGWPDCGNWWVPCWQEFKFGITCMFPLVTPAMPFAVGECIDQFPRLQVEQRTLLLCGGGLLIGYGVGRQVGVLGPAVSCATLYFNWQAEKAG